MSVELLTPLPPNEMLRSWALPLHCENIQVKASKSVTVFETGSLKMHSSSENVRLDQNELEPNGWYLVRGKICKLLHGIKFHER